MSTVVDHPPGVYFGLDEAAYHADVALGSGDMRRLATNPFDFWWGSRFNPNRKPEKLTDALYFGRAVHTAVLEGLPKFKAMYAPVYSPGSTRAGIDERDRAKRLNMLPINSDDYEQIMLAGTAIKSNPYLAEAFSLGGSEVSVFWVRDGIKRKARLDYVKRTAIVDLKSIRNTRDVDFRAACRSRASEARYDAQAAHYIEGRNEALKHIRSGHVFGSGPDGLLLSLLAAGEQYAFVFVFLQVDGSPLTWALQFSPGNPILDAGRAHIERAEANWRAFNEKFGGIETPWVLAEPPEEADINDFKPWAFQ